MDFKQLEAFVAVAKHKSFSKAARELFLSQPTISSHIQNLEKELDTILINRNNKAFTLTKSGEILYSHAIYILSNCNKAIYDLKEFSGKIEGVIDIACSSIPETYILPQFLRSFSINYPDVKFNISHYDSQYAISEILDERVSFGFVGSKKKNTQIKYIDLADDELVLITPKNLNLENTNGYVDVEELYRLNFIMRKDGSGTRDLIYSTLKENNVNLDKLNILAHVESDNAVKEMVRFGVGASLISHTSALDYINNDYIASYKINNINFVRKFYFIYSKKKVFTPLENKFFDNLSEYFKFSK